MKQKLTTQGLRDYILEIALPEPFTLNDVRLKMGKHHVNTAFSYRHMLRPILTQLVSDGLLMEKLGSEKRVHGSVTESYYSKV